MGSLTASYFASIAMVLALLSSAASVNAVGGEMEFNRRATATAQILAGIMPNPVEPALKKFVESDAFKEHHQWMTSNWSQVKGRVQTMDSWRSQEIKLSIAQRKNLLYPFSGPDFLNAYTFFPEHSRYFFLASSGRDRCRI